MSGSVLLYSNEEELVNFYLQAIDYKTEHAISPFLNFSDGYAIKVFFQWSYARDINEDLGFCISSQNHGESCIALKPRG